MYCRDDTKCTRTMCWNIKSPENYLDEKKKQCVYSIIHTRRLRNERYVSVWVTKCMRCVYLLYVYHIYSNVLPCLHVIVETDSSETIMYAKCTRTEISMSFKGYQNCRFCNAYPYVPKIRHEIHFVTTTAAKPTKYNKREKRTPSRHID